MRDRPRAAVEPNLAPTVDMNEAWAGELVIEKVPVKQVK